MAAKTSLALPLRQGLCCITLKEEWLWKVAQLVIRAENRDSLGLHFYVFKTASLHYLEKKDKLIAGGGKNGKRR